MENPKPELQCPLCRGTSFTGGFAIGHAALRFMPGELSMPKTLISQGEPILAKKCDSCGHLLLFAKSP